MSYRKIFKRFNMSSILIIVFYVNILLFVACGGSGSDSDGSGSDGGGGGIVLGETKSFKATNLINSSVYTVNAKLLYIGSYCLVYRENNSGIYMDDTVAMEMGQEFDSNIYDKIVNNFGAPSDVNTDGKVTLLVLDIKDGFSGSGGYVAGYFDPTNEFDTASEPDSNETDMLYMDSYPGAADIDGFKITMAHEFQHLVNFNQKVFIQGSPTGFDTWINEGMSSAAEKIYSGSQVQWKIDYYNQDPYGDIAMGQQFVAWGNTFYTSVLGNYATVYLFFQWLSIHAGGDSVYKSIMNNTYDDYRAVYNEVSPLLTGYTGVNFGDLLRYWFIANLLNNATDLYGYGGDISSISVPYLNDLNGYPTGTGLMWDLLPGEGIYLRISGSHTISSSSPIYYAGITNAGAIDITGTLYTGDALLCYNKNGRSTDAYGTTGALPNIIPGNGSKIMKLIAIVEDKRIYPIDVVFNADGKPSLPAKRKMDKGLNKFVDRQLK